MTRRLRALLVLAAPPAVLAGCGGVGAALTRSKPSDDLTPNYLHQPGISTVRWAKPEITYRIHADSINPLVDPPRTIERGLREWERALKGLRTLRRVYSGIPDIDIRLVREAEVSPDAEPGYWGLTFLDYEDDGITLRHADVHLWKALLPKVMQTSATHEMGHALGIRGHEGGHEESIMTKDVPSFGLPTKADLNTLRSLYAR